MFSPILHTRRIVKSFNRLLNRASTEMHFVLLLLGVFLNPVLKAETSSNQDTMLAATTNSASLESMLSASSSDTLQLIQAGSLIRLFVFLGIIILLIVLFFYIFRSKTTPLSRALSDEDKGSTRSLLGVRFFILATGFLFLLTEFVCTIFYSLSLPFFLANSVLFLLCLALFFILQKWKPKLTTAELLLSSIYLTLNLSLLIRFKGHSTDLLAYGLFCMLMFYSYSVFSSLKYFFIYAGSLAVLLALAFKQGQFSENETAIYLCTIFLLSLVNLARHLQRKNTERYLLFTNRIVNDGSSLIVCSNSDEELVFVSENVKDILGYQREELHSTNWFLKTLAPEDKEEDIFKKLQLAKHNGETYSRKMRTAWGTFKWIQWQYKKFGNDLWVGIGQDITQHIHIQQEYQNLIESASDIIHKTDKDGNFLFFNRHLENLLGYKSEELIGKHHTLLVRKDHVNRLKSYYERTSKQNPEFETIEFAAVKKTGEEIWLAQNITVERDSKGDILSYNSIVRDITNHKQAEQESLNKHLKVERNSKLLRELTFVCTSKDLSLPDILKQVMEKTSGGIKADRVSIWACYDNHIISSYFFEKENQQHWFREIQVAKEDHPGYFNILKRGEIVAAEDVLDNEATRDFVEDYFQEHDTKSLLDVPIFIDGKLEFILCNEAITQRRNWDNEDINFVRSVAGLLTIAIESNKRKQAEAQLAERSKVLAAVGKITEQLLTNDHILPTLVENLGILGEAINADRVYVYRHSQNHQTLELVKAWYANSELAPCTQNLTDSLLFQSIREFFNEHSRNFHLNLLTRNLNNESLKKELEAQHVKSVLVFPILTDKQLLGFIGIDACSDERIWSRDVIVLMSSLVTNLVHAIRRAQNEIKIQESENNFREINESINDVFWLYDDLHQKYLYISPSCEAVLGMSQKEFYKGEDFGDRFVLKDDLPAYRNAIASLKIRSGYEVEYRIRNKNGEIRWISEKSSAIRNESGTLIRNSGICTDITEKKHFLNRIRQLSLVAEKTNNGVLILDRNGYVLWANQSYLNILETPLDKVLNRRPSDLFHYRSEPHANKMEAINSTNYHIVFEVQTFLGNKKWIEVSNTIVEDEEANTLQQIQIVTDITQKRVKDLELAQHRAMLRKYSSYLEYQNELKEKLLHVSSIEEISQVALKFAKDNIKHCVHISLLTLDEKKQVMSGFFIIGEKILKERHPVSSFKSFASIKTGEMFIEHDLTKSEKSVSDEILIEAGAASYVVLPLLDVNELIGQLTVTFDIPFQLGETEIENLKNLAINLSTTIQKLNLKNFLQEKNNDIRDSLNYARNIQKTVLPDLSKNLPSLNNVVLLFEPKDIVSGDFYWAKETENYLFVALGDCTGHGVPGAFLTIIGTRILEQIVLEEKFKEPGDILAEFDRQLYLSLNAGHNEMIRDGMEIALCMIDKLNRILHFSGVGMGLVYYKGDEEVYLKGVRGSIGDFNYNEVGFENTSIHLNGKERFYMASDGYQDQLGGTNMKRFSKKRLLELLIEIKSKDNKEQERILKHTIQEHMKDHFQTDDISVLGFQLNIKTNE